MSEESPQIIVRRPRRKKHGHHGGAWKVAYADFVTAMMAFFLVMWLIGVGTREQRAAIAEYFKNPSMTPGNATIAPPGHMGPGGASDSMIKLGGAMDRPHGQGQDRRSLAVAGKAGKGSQDSDDTKGGKYRYTSQADAAAKARQEREREAQRLDELKQQLNAAIQQSQALAPFKDQLLIDITPEGLRIQIVDKLNRPMFDLGRAQLKPYTEAILLELAGFIEKVPNKISISGHTDNAPYGSDKRYSNWELSADRANAARRELVAGGLPDDKIARVVGLAASVPFDRTHPGNPINRRISIIVMTKEAEQHALLPELADAPPKPAAAPAMLPPPLPLIRPAPPGAVQTVGSSAPHPPASP